MGDKIDWKPTALGFGCMRLPTKKFLFFFKKVDEKESIRIIRHAIDEGVNYIDTAFPYHGGKSELIVGKALQDGYRDKIHLVTKLPMWKVSKAEDFDRFLNEQLEKLQTDYLDIYLFHALNSKHFKILKDLNLIKKMEEAKKAGKIKHIGFSFHDNLDVFKEIIDYYDWDCCQIQYNYMDTGIQATTKGLEYAASKGIGVIIMEPVKGGKLANPSDEVKQLMDTSSIKHSPVDWALQFLWDKPQVSIVLSGMGNMQMVEENIESASNSGIGKLTEKEKSILEKLAELYRNLILIPCTKCNYCIEECPNGVNIPEIFDILNEYSRDKNLKNAQKRYKKLVNDASKIDKNNPNGSPDVCTKCNTCVERCPQQINIPEMTQRVKMVMAENKPINEVF